MEAGVLWRVAGDFVSYVQVLGRCGGETFPPPAALRAKLLGLLAPLQKVQSDPEVPLDEIEEARFALVAWADELILKSRWVGRDEWLSEPLQLHLYRTTRAGNEFYVHLERLGKQKMAAREVYFLVLTLGFEGQLAGQDADRRALIALQYELLRSSGRLLETPRESLLSPAAYDLDVELPDPGRSWLGVGLVALGLGLVLAYALLWGALYWLSPEVGVLAIPGLGA